MLTYNVNRANVALSTAADLLTITAASAKALRIWAITIGGQGTLSANNTVGVYRVGTLGATAGGLITPTAKNQAMPASGFTVATTWTTQPVVGAIVELLSVNANGGGMRWVASQPALAIFIPAGATAISQLSIRAANGTSPVSISMDIEEL